MEAKHRFTRRIGYLVIPPGCGKSHHHLKIPGLLEADGIFDCKGTPELKRLRAIAKETGDWTNYDAAWSVELLKRLPIGKCLIMVPHESIGQLIGGEYLGSAKLEEQQWALNLKCRGKRLEDYAYTATQIQHFRSFPSNDMMSNWIMTYARSHLRNVWCDGVDCTCILTE